MKSLGRFFWLGCGAIGVAALLFVLLTSGLLGFQLFQLEWKTQGKTDLTFEEVALPFENVSDLTAQTGSLPFMAGVVIDVDGDLTDDVFLGGGRDQADALMRYDVATNAFVDVSNVHALDKQPGDATLGGASIDVNDDGLTDLLVARESGIWLYMNQNGKLSGARLDLDIAENTTPLSISLGDINKDGFVDFYVSGYIKNSLVEGQTNFDKEYGGYSHLFLNDGVNIGGVNIGGDNSWTDVSEEMGVWRQHNTFTALFADIDADADVDLVVAQDTGHVEIYENTGAPFFQLKENPSVYCYPMGLAAGDFTGDGAVDFYFSNVGHTLPEQLLRGNLPEDANFNPNYMLFQNDGAGNFIDAAKNMKAARFGFGWGVVAADLNLDGWDDIIIAQNYAKFGQPAIVHRYAGKILQNQNGERFWPVEKRAGAENRLFAISPLVGDFNGDHLPDLIWANLNGPSKAFLNKSEDRNFIEILVDDNARSLNANIDVEIGERIVTKQIVASQGLASDQTHKILIGLGDDNTADLITITFLDGRKISRENIAAGTVVDWREGDQ